MVGFIVMLSDFFSRALFWGRVKDRDDDSKANGFLMLIGLIFLFYHLFWFSYATCFIKKKRIPCR